MSEVHVEQWEIDGDIDKMGATEVFEIAMPEISYNRATLEQMINTLKHHLEVMHGGGVLDKDGGDLEVTTTGTAGEYNIAPGGIVVGRELIVYDEGTIVVPADGDYIYVTDEYMIDYGASVPSNAEVLAQISGGSVTDMRTQLANGDEVVRARGDYSTLDARLNNVANLAETLDTDLSDLDSRLTTEENNVDTLQSDLSSLQTTVSDLQTEINNARASFASLDARLDDIESRLSTLESA